MSTIRYGRRAFASSHFSPAPSTRPDIARQLLQQQVEVRLPRKGSRKQRSDSSDTACEIQFWLTFTRSAYTQRTLIVDARPRYGRRNIQEQKRVNYETRRGLGEGVYMRILLCRLSSSRSDTICHLKCVYMFSSRGRMVQTFVLYTNFTKYTNYIYTFIKPAGTRRRRRKHAASSQSIKRRGISARVFFPPFLFAPSVDADRAR